MVRRLPYLARLLLTGIAATILISWSLAVWSPVTTADVNRPPSFDNFPPFGVTPPAGWDLRTWVSRRGPGLRHEVLTEMEWIGSTLGMMDGRNNRLMERACAGWPIPCLQWATDDDTEPGPILRGLPIPVPHRDFPERRLPLRPLWVPFILNALIFAGAAAGARAGFVSVRGNRRVRRGRCRWCGYPLGSPTRCPECGHLLRLVQEPPS